MKKVISTLIVLTLAFSAQSQSWLLRGNGSVSPDSNFIGTTDLQPLLFRINNYPAGFLDPRTTNLGFGYFALSTNPLGNPPMHGGQVTANTAFGRSALSATTSGGWNTATGYGALGGNTSGSNNTATGMRALQANAGGNGNTAVGALSLVYNTGTGNTAVGSNTISAYMHPSYYNTVVGYFSGSKYILGWNNTLLGANCDVNTNDRYNCIAIGQGVTCTANSQARIGNSATVSIGGYAGWTNISDGRYKKDIQQNVTGLDFIMKLKPVTYHLDISGLSKKLDEGRGKSVDEFMQKAIQEKEKILYSGFVAQDVEKAAKESGYDFSGIDKPQSDDDLYGLRYADFVVPLVKSVQELQQMNASLMKQNANMQKRIEELEKRQGIKSYADEGLTVWPNPSGGNIFINITANKDSRATIRITDNNGLLIKMEQKNLVIGENQFTTDINGFAKGLYHISAEWNGGLMKKTSEVVKQ